MVENTAGKKHPEEITVAKLKRRTKCKASEKTILRQGTIRNGTTPRKIRSRTQHVNIDW